MSKKGLFTSNVLDRNEAQFTKERSGDVTKLFHTQDSNIHKFQEAREYTRALNATKLDKVFAKPFIAAFDAHTDGIYAMAKIPNALPYMLAGDGDGVIKLWHLGTHQQLWTAKAHTGRVRGVCAEPNGKYAISCSADRTIKLWNVDTRDESMSMTHSNGVRDQVVAEQDPLQVFAGNSLFSAVDHHRKKKMFVSCGDTVDIWDPNRPQPIHSFQWGADSILSVKCNYVDTDVIASTGSDRSVVLYDIRSKTPLHKVVLLHMNNAISWNPQEAYNFIVGSEDTNVYTFDMRNLRKPSMVHRDHVAAVLSVDYAPTGKEFVSGSYDKSIRLWENGSQKSRDIYHNKRMQHIFSIQYSQDSKYVCSGSDDGNIRVWKAVSNDRLGVTNKREQMQLDYTEKLKERYSTTKEIHKIATKQLIPKHIKVAQATRKEIDRSRIRKLTNVAEHRGKKNVKLGKLKQERVDHEED